jgi:hypothetical protein
LILNKLLRTLPRQLTGSTCPHDRTVALRRHAAARSTQSTGLQKKKKKEKEKEKKKKKAVFLAVMMVLIVHPCCQLHRQYWCSSSSPILKARLHPQLSWSLKVLVFRLDFEQQPLLHHSLCLFLCWPSHRKLPSQRSKRYLIAEWKVILLHSAKQATVHFPLLKEKQWLEHESLHSTLQVVVGLQVRH